MFFPLFLLLFYFYFIRENFSEQLLRTRLDSFSLPLYNEIKITLVSLQEVLMHQLPQISEAEYEVMKVVWEYAPIGTNEVVEKLSHTHDWGPKTVQTMLSRLAKKGVLTYEKDSRMFVYSPLVKQEDYIRQESDSFLNRFFNGNVGSMVSAFLDQEELSTNEIDELQALLKRKMKKGDS